MKLWSGLRGVKSIGLDQDDLRAGRPRHTLEMTALCQRESAKLLRGAISKVDRQIRHVFAKS